jgi:hypothetical protein
MLDKPANASVSKRQQGQQAAARAATSDAGALKPRLVHGDIPKLDRDGALPADLACVCGTNNPAVQRQRGQERGPRDCIERKPGEAGALDQVVRLGKRHEVAIAGGAKHFGHELVADAHAEADEFCVRVLARAEQGIELVGGEPQGDARDDLLRQEASHRQYRQLDDRGVHGPPCDDGVGGGLLQHRAEAAH